MPTESRSIVQKYALIFAVAMLLLIVLLPTPAGLPVAGQRMLGILVFAVIVWMTETVSYPVSAAILVTLMALLLGTAPAAVGPVKLLGTTGALGIALGGFSNTAWALVAGALFLAAAMTRTGLDKRIALFVLSKIGARTNRVLIGVILVGFILSFFVPSTTARVSCLVPIVMGIITVFGVKQKSRFAGMMLIATAQADSLWNVGIKTAAAQNMVAVSFIQKQLGVDISWMKWFIAAAPFSAIMSVVLYWVLMKMMPPEVDEIPGGKAAVAKSLRELGPMTGAEKRLLSLSLILLCFWTTEGSLHTIDTSTTTIAAITIMLLPGIGVMNWKEAQDRIPWGTLVLFGVGISLGSALLSTQAAAWLAKGIVGLCGLHGASAFMILVVLSLFLIVIHLGFASATALAAAMIPIIISVLQAVKTPGLNIVGLTMILQYVVSFGMLLPVNAPQNMIAYSTGTFEVKDFVRTGIPLTIAAYALILLLGATYWKWLGLV
ncbi:MAG: DASS family sodium-coupled anion symporter [Holophaga sp.]|nr:DASS family sodium-coupled anion symporter [Holophaga sp.]